MAISISGITLPKQTRWLEELNYCGVRQETDVTLGAKPVVWAQKLEKGTPFTLDISLPRAYLDNTALQAVRALAVVPGQLVSLNWHGALYSCVFSHPNALEVKPVMDYNDQTEDWFELKISLLHV